MPNTETIHYLLTKSAGAAELAEILSNLRRGPLSRPAPETPVRSGEFPESVRDPFPLRTGQTDEPVMGTGSYHGREAAPDEYWQDTAKQVNPKDTERINRAQMGLGGTKLPFKPTMKRETTPAPRTTSTTQDLTPVKETGAFNINRGGLSTIKHRKPLPAPKALPVVKIPKMPFKMQAAPGKAGLVRSLLGLFR